MNAVPEPGHAARPLAARRLLIALCGTLMLLAACEPETPPVENDPQWVIRSRVSFVGSDLATPRDALPLSSFRLTFPYVAGDLYGAPSIADFIHPKINPDYSFEIDLNRTQADLVRSLQPTEFNEEYLRIDPADARIARLTPQALQADGIEQVAATDWVDRRTHQPLMLVYFDRPARITGAVTRNGHTTRYNVRASKAGYVWIGVVQNEDSERMYREVDRPEQVILALAPKTDDINRLPPPVVPPADAMAARDSAASTEPGTAQKEEPAAHPQPDLRGADNPRRAAARDRGVPDR
jgi:hypothetical protein